MAEKTAAETVLDVVKGMFGNVGTEENTATALAGKNLPLGIDNRANPELQYNMLSHTEPAAETVARGIADVGLPLSPLGSSTPEERALRQQRTTKLFDAITPGESPLPVPPTEPTIGIGKDMPEKVRAGKGGGIAPEAPKTALEQTLSKGLETHKGDVYEMLRDPSVLSDQQFMDFVRKHGDSVKGIGYVEDPSKKGKKGWIERVVDRPEAPTPASESPNLTPAERAALQTAEAHKETAKSHTEYTKQLGIQNQAYKELAIREKANEGYQKFLSTHGKTSAGELDPEMAYFRAGVNNIPLPSALDAKDAASHQKAIQQATLPVLEKIRLNEQKKGGPLTPAERQRVIAAYEKERGWTVGK